MSKITGQSHSGSFLIEGREILGTLEEAGEQTNLYLHDPKFFNVGRKAETTVHGKLHNLIKVSLLDCLCPGTGSLGMQGDRIHTANVFPHYIVSGDRHLGDEEKVISQIHFRIGDADTLFYDFDAFGEVIHSEKFIRDIVNANQRPGEPETPVGEYPHIFYFTGVYDVADFDTPIGRFGARHSPSYKFPGPHGFEFNNAIVTSLAFTDPVNFRTALQGLIDVQRYLGLLIGRPQNVTGIVLAIPEPGRKHPHLLEVDWSMIYRYDYATEKRNPHPMDVLIDPIGAKESFAAITRTYFSKGDAWQTPRSRFYGNFAERRHYSVDRLVSAANMFDILPDSLLGEPPKLVEAVRTAKETARVAFKALPPSADRESILGALGRLGKWTLKKKIASRLESFAPLVEDRLPELGLVCDKAVNARNYFVHGGDQEFDYNKFERLLWMFVDTLEFTFAASDLADAGWNLRTWMDKSSISHRFGGFVHEYRSDLALLKKALAEAKDGG